MRLSFLFLTFFFTIICFSQEIDIKPAKIESEILNPKRALTIKEPFNTKNVLRELFPGTQYGKSDGSYFISWICKTCNTSSYTDVNGVEGDQIFPYPEGVATRPLADIDYADSKGNQFKIIAFNHSVHDEDGLQTGRFSGGLLGLAKFAKNNNVWEMRSFQSAVAAFGAFAQCPTPKLVEIGEDQFAFTLLHVNGGAGGPFEGWLYLVAGFDGKYQPILEVDNYQLTNVESVKWSGSYSVVNDNVRKHFRDIIIKTTGSFNKAARANDEFEFNLPEELATMAKTKKSFNFEIERHYSFKGKFYKMIDKPIVKFFNIK